MSTLTLMRSLLSTPGNRENMLEKARGLPADGLHLDLEDSVPPLEKERARQVVCRALPGFALFGQTVVVRVNSLSSGLIEADLDSVVMPGVDGISLPKVGSPRDVAEVDEMISQRELKAGLSLGSTSLFVWIETPGAVVSAYPIACASHRVRALLLGADDFTREMDIPRTKQGRELSYARWAISVAARAAGVLALDTGYPDYRDEKGLISEARLARRVGFHGKFLIHPDQIGPVNRIFSPAPEDVEEAKRVIEAFEEAVANGRATTALDGSMIDTAIAGRARRLLAMAKAVENRESS